MPSEQDDVRDLLEHGPVAASLVGPEGTIRWANQALCLLTRHGRDELIGRPLGQLLVDPRRAEELLQRLVRGEAIQSWPASVICKGGLVRQVLINANVHRQSNAVVAVRCFITAIPDPSLVAACAANHLARLQEERQANVELEHRIAERTEELSEVNAELEDFAYSIAHDLRAPLRAIHGFAQALVEDYAPQLDATGQDYAHRLIAAASRLDQLIRDLLSYSRLSRHQIQAQRLELDVLVADVLGSMEDELCQCRAQVEIQDPLPPVMAHRPTLVQVLANLLSNAIKFVAPGTCPRIRVRAEPRDDAVRLWIEDNGIGIAPEHQARIFKPFERLHGIEVYPGTGIGLAMVRRGVERMRGRVGLESQVGQGSRFWIELPRARSD